jgi:uncharacterized membrane protein
MNFTDYIKQWINQNPGKAVGGFAGLVLGIFILALGIPRTIIVILFVLIGLLIGKLKDDRVSVIDEIKGIFSRKR